MRYHKKFAHFGRGAYNTENIAFDISFRLSTFWAHNFFRVYFVGYKRVREWASYAVKERFSRNIHTYLISNQERAMRTSRTENSIGNAMLTIVWNVVSLLVVWIAISGIVPAEAMNASPYTFMVEQDDEEIILKIKGDEDDHWITNQHGKCARTVPPSVVAVASPLIAHQKLTCE